MFEELISTLHFPSVGNGTAMPASPLVDHAARIMVLRDERFHIGHFVVKMPDEVHWSPEMYEICGVTHRSSPLTLADVISPFEGEDRARLAEAVAEALKHRKGFQGTLRVRRADGELRLVETVGDVVVEDGHLAAVVGLMRDVTEVTRGPAPAEESSRMKALVEAMPVPAVLTDRTMRIVACSDLWSKSHGVPRNEAIGKDLVEAVEKAPVGWALEHEKVVAGKTITTERTFHNPTTGRPVRCPTTLCPWRAEDGAVQGVLTMIGWSEFAFASKEVANHVRKRTGGR